MASAAATADPGYYVVTAYDNEGVGSVDFRYWTVRFPGRDSSFRSLRWCLLPRASGDRRSEVKEVVSAVRRHR